MKLNYTFILLFSIFLIGCIQTNSTEEINIERSSLDLERTKAKANEAYNFVKSSNYNTDFCILVDMSVHSGLKRFLIWDFNNNEIQDSFLVSHGCCDGRWSSDHSKENPTFSNVPNSYCSSLGKYKIGERGPSQWGVRTKYLLHGLEETNNKATQRDIVFHSWERVKDEEVYPKETVEGHGCPAISDNAFRKIDPLIKSCGKPVLMWIYN